ncbi:MAG: T9SS type A sorting domain-containing protein [Bacteroidales bacterium]|nr:T9SS type A sorting domain-containing protein [Bacteroidales bacterium]
MKTLTISFILIFLFLYVNSFADSIYLPPGSNAVFPSGSNMCSDTVYVDTNATLTFGDSSVFCPGIVLRGGGLIIISVQNTSSEIPESFALYQNFPNPFNPTTKIKFDILKTSDVKLIIYNSLGKEIGKLVNEKLQPGTYNVDFKGNNHPSGVYFYKLITDEFIDVKKMVLVK